MMKHAFVVKLWFGQRERESLCEGDRETPVTRTNLRLNVIVTPVNGRFAHKISWRCPNQVRNVSFLCLPIIFSAEINSEVG